MCVCVRVSGLPLPALRGATHNIALITESLTVRLHALCALVQRFFAFWLCPLSKILQAVTAFCFFFFFQSRGLSTSVWMHNQNFLFVSWLQSLWPVGLGRISPVACVLPRIHPLPPPPPPVSHFLLTTAVSVEQLHGEVRLASASSSVSPIPPPAPGRRMQ